MELIPEHTAERIAWLEEQLKAADHRIKKLEKAVVGLDHTLARYIGTRIALDNQTDRRTKAVHSDLREVRERLGDVELAAFPEVSGVIAKLVGQRGAGDRSDALDRRKPRASP